MINLWYGMLNYDEEDKRLKASLLNLGPVVPGTLRKVFLRCGKKNCRCQRNQKRSWHGPYVFWDRKDGKKLASRSISSENVHVIRGWIRNRKELERIVRLLLKNGIKEAGQLKTQK